MAYERVGLKAVVSIATAAGCLWWQCGVAQTAATGQGAVVATDNGEVLEDIIVTARRVEENLQKVPVAVSAVSGEFLQQQQITDVYSLQNVVPSLQSESGSLGVNQPVFAIRGIGTAVLGIQVEPSVGIAVDEVPMARPELANIPFFDLGRVEVLRGPQGVLFGLNIPRLTSFRLPLWRQRSLATGNSV